MFTSDIVRGPGGVGRGGGGGVREQEPIDFLWDTVLLGICCLKERL